jgi:hypothetical protein
MAKPGDTLTSRHVSSRDVRIVCPRLKSNITERNCARLGCYAASSGNSVPTFRDNLSVPSYRVKNQNAWVSTGSPKTSLRNYHYSLRNILKCEHFSSSSWRKLEVMHSVRLQLKCDGTRWRMGGEVKGKLANGVGEPVLFTLPRNMVYPALLHADAHTSAASIRLNWRPRRFKWTRPFRRKTKSGFCACAITFQLAFTKGKLYSRIRVGDLTFFWKLQ